MKVISLSVAFALICSTALAAASESFSQRLPFGPAHALILENTNGTIVVETWDRPEILIEGTKRGKTTEDLSYLHIQMESSDENISVKTVQSKQAGRKKRWWQRSPENLRVDYRVKVPARGRMVRIESANGQVRVSGFGGRWRSTTSMAVSTSPIRQAALRPKPPTVPFP